MYLSAALAGSTLMPSVRLDGSRGAGSPNVLDLVLRARVLDAPLAPVASYVNEPRSPTRDISSSRSDTSPKIRSGCMTRRRHTALFGCVVRASVRTYIMPDWIARDVDLQHFPLPTSSLASVSLSPTGNYLAVWEGPLEVLSLQTSYVRGSSGSPTRRYSTNSTS